MKSTTPTSSLSSTSSAISSASSALSIEDLMTTTTIGTKTAKPSSASKTSDLDYKLQLVSGLIDSTVILLETLWPKQQDSKSSSSPSLLWFVSETLRRSKSSYSTLQVALYYLILLKPKILSITQLETATPNCLLDCPRRTFLTSLIVSAKYLQDQTYSLKSWSRITGLRLKEIKNYELQFLKAIKYDLYIKKDVYYKWSSLLLKSANPIYHNLKQLQKSQSQLQLQLQSQVQPQQKVKIYSPRKDLYWWRWIILNLQPGCILDPKSINSIIHNHNNSINENATKKRSSESLDNYNHNNTINTKKQRTEADSESEPKTNVNSESKRISIDDLIH